MFKTNKELRAELEEAAGKIETLQTVNGEQADEIASLNNQLAEAREDLSAARDEATANANDLESARAEITELECKLTEQSKATEAAEQSAGAKAAEIVAAAGHPPVDVEPDADSETSSTPHLDKFESLSGAAASTYYRKHKSAIVAEGRGR